MKHDKRTPLAQSYYEDDFPYTKNKCAGGFMKFLIMRGGMTINEIFEEALREFDYYDKSVPHLRTRYRPHVLFYYKELFYGGMNPPPLRGYSSPKSTPGVIYFTMIQVSDVKAGNI